jgi:hypothetical protein
MTELEDLGIGSPVRYVWNDSKIIVLDACRELLVDRQVAQPEVLNRELVAQGKTLGKPYTQFSQFRRTLMIDRAFRVDYPPADPPERVYEFSWAALLDPILYNARIFNQTRSRIGKRNIPESFLYWLEYTRDLQPASSYHGIFRNLDSTGNNSLISLIRMTY